MRYIPGSLSEVVSSLNTEDDGALSIGEDGVLRSFAGNLSVIDYRQLDASQSMAYALDQMEQITADGGGDVADSMMTLAFTPVDGRKVTDVDLLFNPEEKPSVDQLGRITPRSLAQLARDTDGKKCVGKSCKNSRYCNHRGCSKCMFGPRSRAVGSCLA